MESGRCSLLSNRLTAELVSQRWLISSAVNRFLNTPHPHVFEVQNIVSGRVQPAHVARLRFYADSQLTLNVTADVKDVF